jgi:hypothetical protein
VVCWRIVLLQGGSSGGGGGGGGGGGAMLTRGECGCGDGCMGRHAASEGGHMSVLCCTVLLHPVLVLR